MSTLEQRWEVFKESSIPKDASDIQVKEMMNSFYAGALSMAMGLGAIADKIETEEIEETRINEFANEAYNYFSHFKYENGKTKRNENYE